MEPLTDAEIAAVPPESWEKARLAPIEAFRLLSFRYPVNAYLQSVRDEDHNHPDLKRKDTFIAIYRRDYSVWRHDLSQAAFDLLDRPRGGQAAGQGGGGGPRPRRPARAHDRSALPLVPRVGGGRRVQVRPPALTAARVRVAPLRPFWYASLGL